MQEAGLVQPTLFLDEHAMHERDLAGRPAERQKADPGEHACRFAQGYGRRIP